MGRAPPILVAEKERDGMTFPGNKQKASNREEALRVDHAGEYGARRIYEGQLAILKGTPAEKKIRHMYEQEKAHLDTFDGLLREHRVRPSALMPLWHVGGFMLGAATALLGEKAAMACTVAVESVIGEHYGEQLETLPAEETALKETITRFRDEEMEHHQTGLDQGAEAAPAYPALYHGIRALTRTAVWVAKRI